MEMKFSKDGLTYRLNLICDQQFGGRMSNLHRASGVPQANLSGYKEGKEPNLDALTKIASACNVTTDWLLTGEGPMRREEETAVILHKEGLVYVAAFSGVAPAGAQTHDAGLGGLFGGVGCITWSPSDRNRYM